jgi:chromosome segregation ATPase
MVSDDTVNHIKTDIALIKNDLKQIERFFDKVDGVIDEISDLSKGMAVQQQIIERFDQKLDYLEEKIDTQARINVEARFALKEELDDHKQNFKTDMVRAMEDAKNKHAEVNERSREWHEDRHRETIRLIENIAKDLNEKVDGQEERIRNIENLKWWLIGAIAVITFIVQFLDVSMFHINS